MASYLEPMPWQAEAGPADIDATADAVACRTCGRRHPAAQPCGLCADRLAARLEAHGRARAAALAEAHDAAALADGAGQETGQEARRRLDLTWLAWALGGCAAGLVIVGIWGALAW